MDAFAEAIKFARAGHYVSPAMPHAEHRSAGLAFPTNDADYLLRVGNRESNYFLRTSAEDSLYTLRLAKAHATDRTLQRDLRLLFRDTGIDRLPRTPTIELAGAVVVYLLFARRVDDPNFLFGKAWKGAGILLSKRCPLSGSTHVASGCSYRWRVPPTVPYAHLPRAMIPHLPQVAPDPDSIMANVVARDEFDPHHTTEKWDEGPPRYALGNAREYYED
jgi:hypothetical protein